MYWHITLIEGQVIRKSNVFVRLFLVGSQAWTRDGWVRSLNATAVLLHSPSTSTDGTPLKFTNSPHYTSILGACVLPGTVNHFDEFLCFGAGIFSDCLVNRPEVWISDDKDEFEDELKLQLPVSQAAAISGNGKALKRRKWSWKPTGTKVTRTWIKCSHHVSSYLRYSVKKCYLTNEFYKLRFI